MIKMKFSDEDLKLAEQIAAHYRSIIELIGEDPDREGLAKTPMRAAKALIENTRGYHEDADAIVEHEGSEIVIVKDIEFYSLCEHHILPFFGKVSIGYIPAGGIVGLSKLARIVDTFSRRLQVQERMTHDICELLARVLPNRGVIVYAEAQHMCMKMRGVEKQDSTTITFEYSGEFEDIHRQNEFFTLLGVKK